MSRFLKSPRRLAPNQPWGYLYQPLRAPRAHPLWVASRGHVVLTHGNTVTQHTHTLVYMQIQHTHNHTWRHSHIWYEATGKSVVTYLHRVGAHRGLCGVLKFCLTSGKGFYFRLLRHWKESTDSTLKQTKCRIFLLFRGAINVMYRFQTQTELPSAVKWVNLL